MNKLILFTILMYTNLFSTNFGAILSTNESSSLIAKDISKILKEYKIDLEVKNTKFSYTNIEKLLNNRDNNFFAIVKKDAISYYNQKNSKDSSVYNKIPAILSLGSEQIHIYTNINNDFDFEIKKTFNVYCGQINSDSCISTLNIKNAYSFKFNYIKSSNKTIFSDLKNNKIDLFISVKSAPYKKYKNIKNVKLIDLPTNFKMEEIYTHSLITNQHYKYIDESIHAFSSPRVLITNLIEEKYNNSINALLKIILLNQNYLIKQNNFDWKSVDFEYFDFKKFSFNAKKTIKILNQQRKKQDALIF